jgi:hypothetical protein
MQDTGTLAEHLFQLFREPLADSSWSDRRLRLPWEIFAELMRSALRPRAIARQHREAFWRSWRVVALDGTQFSLINTAQITDTFPKAVTRRGRAAFAKMTTAVLLEVGLHNPLAAAVGRNGESEWALAQRLLAQLPKRSLLLGDRLYGVIAFASAAQRACRRVGSQFLLRASRTVKPRRIRRLSDGTRVVGLGVRAPHNPDRVLEWIEVREIRVRVGRKGHRARAAVVDHPAQSPYGARTGTRAGVCQPLGARTVLSRNQTAAAPERGLAEPHGGEGAQEIAAMVLASAVIVSERARAATGTIPALRVSFGQVLHVVRGMWLFFGPFDNVFTARQKIRVMRLGRALIRRSVIAPRRPRTCARAVRQPVRRWPRLLRPDSIQAPWQLQIV